MIPSFTPTFIVPHKGADDHTVITIQVATVMVSGRGADYSTPPPQIPACSFPAPGSRRRSNAIVGLDATDPQARCFSVILSPALSPEHVLQLTFPSTGRLPSATSATDFSRL